MTGLEELKALQVVDLSHNQISSLQGLENHDFLEVINLEDNKVMSHLNCHGFRVYVSEDTLGPVIGFSRGCYFKCRLRNEKMLHVTAHQGNTHQNHTEISPHASQRGQNEQIRRL